MALAAPKVQFSICLVLLHNASRMCAEGGEQGGNDRDDNLTDALQGVLCGVFHIGSPLLTPPC